MTPVVALTLTGSGLAALVVAMPVAGSPRRRWRITAKVIGLAGGVALTIGGSMLAGMSVA